MNVKSAIWWSGACAVALSVGMLASPRAQMADGALGTASLPRAVVADGQPLAAGTYTLRLSDAAVGPVLGLPADSGQWVEFVQGGNVRGRELATKVAAADVGTIAKTNPPSPGTVRVEMLKSQDYVRIWVNLAGTHYLIHLAVEG